MKTRILLAEDRSARILCDLATGKAHNKADPGTKSPPGTKTIGTSSDVGFQAMHR